MSGSTVKFQDKDTATTSEISNTSTFVPMVQSGVNKKLTIPQIHRDAVAVCSIAANVAAKTATVNNMADFALINGITVTVNFTNGNTAESPTLNVNNTGAFRLIKTNQTVSANPSIVWAANSFLELKYIEVGSNKYWLITSIDDYVNTTINGALANCIKVTELSSNIDLNNIKAIGEYRALITGTYTNAPETSNSGGFNLSVRLGKDSYCIVQTIYYYGGKTYQRSSTYSGGWTWTSWEKVATSSDLANYPRFINSGSRTEVQFSTSSGNNSISFTPETDVYLSINSGMWININSQTVIETPSGISIRNGIFIKKGQTVSIFKTSQQENPKIYYWTLL